MTAPATAPIRCVDDPSARVFGVHAWRFVERDQVTNNIIGTLVEAACAGEGSAGQRWIRVLAGGELVGVAVQTPPRGPLLSDLPEPAAHALAAHFAGTSAGLSSVGGPERASAAFAGHYAALTGAAVQQGDRMRLLRLDRVDPPRGVTGRTRVATPADRDLIIAWMRVFSGRVAPEAIDRRFAHGGLMWFWEVDGVPVSFAWRTPLGGVERWPRTSVVRVSAVYTPLGQRGHGYASANVAALSQAALDAGGSACMLYADAANPVSNKIYERIGYRLVSTADEWLFS
jgi:predicted GNAT family acetyltransferase